MNIASRIATIQTSSPIGIEVLTKVNCASISSTEKMLHDMFKGLRYKGEWFYRLGYLDELITRLQTYDEPSEFILGYELGVIMQRANEHKGIVYQHRLRAVYQALVKMKFDINAEQFHNLQNKFISGLIEDHPEIYKRYYPQSDNEVMQLIDAPFQPYPLFEYSVISTPIKDIENE